MCKCLRHLGLHSFLTSCITSWRRDGCGVEQHVVVSNYTVDICFLTNNQTIAEIISRVTTPAADACVMQHPDKSPAVSRRVNANNNAFREVSQKDQENQWTGFLLPPPGAIQKVYTPFFLNNCSQSTGHWAQHCDTALQPFHHLMSPVQHNSEPGKNYGTISPASEGCGELIWAESNGSHIQSVSLTLCVCLC